MLLANTLNSPQASITIGWCCVLLSLIACGCVHITRHCMLGCRARRCMYSLANLGCLQAHLGFSRYKGLLGLREQLLLLWRLKLRYGSLCRIQLLMQTRELHSFRNLLLCCSQYSCNLLLG